MSKEFICNVVPRKRSITSRTCKKSCVLTVTSLDKIYKHAEETETIPTLKVNLPINDKEYYQLTIDIKKLHN